MKINGCTKINAPTDPDMGQNFDPITECPDKLLIHGESTGKNSSIVSVDCKATCLHHKDYKKIKIMNLRWSKPSQVYDVQVDRSSPLGNPFYMAHEEDRDKVCDEYQEWFDEVVSKISDPAAIEIRALRAIYRTNGALRLFCWCAPKRCHGETIKLWLKENS